MNVKEMMFVELDPGCWVRLDAIMSVEAAWHDDLMSPSGIWVNVFLANRDTLRCAITTMEGSEETLRAAAIELARQITERMQRVFEMIETNA